MSKANQHLNGGPERDSTDRKETSKLHGAMMWLGLCLVVSFLCISPVSAETMNWTVVTEMLDGVTTIFPSIANMVTELVPTLLVLAVVGFVLRFFDSIITAISNAMNFIK